MKEDVTDAGDADLEALQRRLQYPFRDPDLLIQALSHPSWSQICYNLSGDDASKHNQRLEFLGDAIIAGVVSETLYEAFPEYREGKLTEARAKLIQGSRLAAWALDLGLQNHLRVGPTERENKIHESPKALEDVFEAVTAAIYLDGGWEAAGRFIRRMAGHLEETCAAERAESNPKGRLQEILQSGEPPETPEYVVVAESGPAHAKEFSAAVRVGGRMLGKGSGSSKKEAEVNAARKALEKLDLDSQNSQPGVAGTKTFR